MFLQCCARSQGEQEVHLRPERGRDQFLEELEGDVGGISTPASLGHGRAAGSDLIEFLGEDDFDNAPDVPDAPKFRLQRAARLCKVCALVYADGKFWASRHPKKNAGDLSGSLCDTSVPFQYFAGRYHQDYQSGSHSAPLGIVPLVPDFDCDWTCTPRQSGWHCSAETPIRGNIKDGLLHCSGESILQSHTQAILALRAEESETLVVAFRGTEATSLGDIMTDLKFAPAPWSPDESRGKVHRGFLEAFRSIEVKLLNTVEKLVQDRGVKKVLCTGHSLGGGLASLCCLRLAEEHTDITVELYTFGGAVVGDASWKQYFESKVPAGRCYRLVNDQDVVPTLRGGYPYVHIGKEIHFNEIGLWEDPSDARDDDEGSLSEFFDDHKIHNYLRLLDHFSTMALARKDFPQVEGVLHDAWEAFNTPSSLFQLTHVTEATHGREWSYSAQMGPNPVRMKQLLMDHLEIDYCHADLVESEIMRLSQLYQKKCFGYPIFSLACAKLFCQPTAEQNWQGQLLAWRFQQFAPHDHDGDGFLNMSEFKELMHDILFQPHDDSETRRRNFETVKRQFAEIDVNHDGHISFEEYYIWRTLLEESHPRVSVTGQDGLTFRDAEKREMLRRGSRAGQLGVAGTGEGPS